jgi:hypothetical protein
MANQELNSFILKFKNLWRAGKNANLTIKSIAGKAHVSLNVELDDNPADLDQHQHGNGNGSRNGPARQRRRLRRAAARQAEKATDAVNEEEAENATVEKENTENSSVAVKAIVDQPTSTTTDNVMGDLVDEFCSEEEYRKEIGEHLETFEVICHDSVKSENEILSETKNFLIQTFNFCKVKKEDQDFKVVKFEKFDGGLRIIVQVKNIPGVIESVEGLKTWKTEVRKLSKKRTSSPSP